MKVAGNPAQGGEASGSSAGWMGIVPPWLRAALRRGFKRLYRTPGEQSMEVMETLSLGGKRQLILIACNGRRYLVGTGADCVSTIAEICPTPALFDGAPPECRLPACSQPSAEGMRCN